MSEQLAPTAVVDETAPASQSAFAEIKPKMKLTGKVKRTEIQGAIIDVGMEHDGLLHISQLSTEAVKNVTDVVKEGDDVTVYVLAVDAKKGRLDLTLIPMPAVSWNELREGMEVEGTVERIEKYGVFVNIGAERPALIHVSQLANGYVSKPEDVVKVGDSIKARVIGVNKRKKQIDLSVKELESSNNKARVQHVEDANDEPDNFVTAMELALRKAMNSEDVIPSKQDKKRKKKSGHDNLQSDIIARTLRFHQDN